MEKQFPETGSALTLIDCQLEPTQSLFSAELNREALEHREPQQPDEMRQGMRSQEGGTLVPQRSVISLQLVRKPPVPHFQQLARQQW